AEAKERHAELAARWSHEKEALDRVKEITHRIDELRMEYERAERAGDFNRAAEIRHGELPLLERELAERDGTQPENAMVKEEVDEDDVAAVVARWTGIPIDRLLEGETEKLIHMEERLHQRVVGQDEAVEAVANALRRARRVHVRRRARDGAARHVRVPGAAHGRAADRRAAGLYRLRGGRTVDGSR